MIDHKRVAVLGAGESGIGAALLAHKKGIETYVSDFGEIKDENKEELKNNNIPFEEKGHDFERLKNVDLVVKSPGIPEKSKVIQYLRSINKMIVSEIEYASWFYKGKILAITGSNGKTTTASLVFHVLDDIYSDVAIAGNIGASFARLLANDFVGERIVLELSSFQLDDIHFFKPDVAILLNITADHLDRYDYEVKKYAKSKMRIFMNMTEHNLAIINENDYWTNQFIEDVKSRIIECSESEDAEFESRLKGKHNQFNMLCAFEGLKELGVEEDVIREKFKEFAAVKHRLETIAFVDGVEFVNDSKATNVDAVKYALGGIEKQIIWIAGGTDKGNNYDELKQFIPKIEALICLGVENEKLKESFKSEIENISETQNIKEAIKMAFRIAKEGEVVLLSPACASFDLFDNYEDRGRQFGDAVFELLKE